MSRPTPRLAVATTALLLSLLVQAPTPSHAAPKRPPSFFAVKCIEFSGGCDRPLAAASQKCKAYTPRDRQPVACLSSGCGWCAQDKFRGEGPCRNAKVRALCSRFKGQRRVPDAGGKPKPKPPRTPPKNPTREPKDDKPPTPGSGGGKGKCDGAVWTGSDKIVVSLGRVTPGSGWKHTSREGLKGIIYRPDRGGGMDGPGKSGRMCFRLRSSRSGSFFATMLSFSPHHTEHNDMWVQSPVLGFKLFGGSVMWKKTYEYTKAYQNEGKYSMSDKMKTRDFRGHRFVVPNVVAGKEFPICISGRSYRFSLFKLYFVRCTNDCANGKRRVEFGKRDGSTCSR